MYKEPKLNEGSFTCPYCKIETGHQFISDKLVRNAYNAYYELYMVSDLTHDDIIDKMELSVSTCARCKQIALWIDGNMVHPKMGELGPEPNEDMPDKVKDIFNEARKVFSVSTKSAAALLRLATQCLCEDLGYKSNINDAIKDMIQDGLDSRVSNALDTIRVIGNHAVHPGVIDIDDNKETVLKLFDLLNFIVKEMITRPKEFDNIFESLPEKDKISIQVRNDKINKK